MANQDDIERTGPLKDLRVIEMGQLLAGPFCGQLLADFGAEVIKLEQPKVGDPMREWGRERPYGKSLWWPVVGRNKNDGLAHLAHMRKTPKRVFSIGALRLAESASARTRRVSAGSMIPSSQRRALA